MSPSLPEVDPQASRTQNAEGEALEAIGEELKKVGEILETAGVKLKLFGGVLKQSGETPQTTTFRDQAVTEEWFKTFFATIVGISTVGAGFTFGVIFTDLKLTVAPANFNAESVRKRLGVCWLLFVITFAVSSAVASYMVFYSQLGPGGIVKKRPIPLKRLSLLSLLLQLLIVGAFMAASLAMMPYGKFGLAAVILTGIAGAALSLIWFVKWVSLLSSFFSIPSDLSQHSSI